MMTPLLACETEMPPNSTMASPSFLLSPGHLLSSGKANSVDYAFPSVSHFSPSNIRHAFSNAYQSCYSMCKSLSFDLRHLSQDIRVPPLDLRLLSQGVRITTCVVLVGALLQRANLVALPRSFARMLCRSLPGRLRGTSLQVFELRGQLEHVETQLATNHNLLCETHDVFTEQWGHILEQHSTIAEEHESVSASHPYELVLELTWPLVRRSVAVFLTWPSSWVRYPIVTCIWLTPRQLRVC